MSERIEKLLNTAFDHRTNGGEASNAFSIARRLAGEKGISAYVRGNSTQNPEYDFNVTMIPASHKDAFVEGLIRVCGNNNAILTSIDIDSQENKVTTPSTIKWSFRSNEKGKNEVASWATRFIDNLNRDRNVTDAPKPKPKQSPKPDTSRPLDDIIREAQRNAAASKPFTYTAPPPKKGFWGGVKETLFGS